MCWDHPDQLSPYSKISAERIRTPKFIYRKTLQFVREIRSDLTVSNWLDVGCANGEFLYYVSEECIETDFLGVDITPEFIKVAEELNHERRNVKFSNQDIFEASTEVKYDVVSCLGTFQIFPDPENLLNKLLDSVAAMGQLIISARFNPHDISAIIRYKDESTEFGKDLWRCDFNIHSEYWIKKMLSKRSDIKNFEFKYPIMDTEIPKKSAAPHINMWTIPREDYGYDITNGMKASFNPSFLIIEKD